MKDSESNGTVQHVFVVGAKSLGAYGGYETFINKLTEYHRCNGAIQYHVACKLNGEGSMDLSKIKHITLISNEEFICNRAHCYRIYVPQWLGAAQAIYYDLAALIKFCRFIKCSQIPHPIVYILACRIGPFAAIFHYLINKMGGKLIINPDGHEWKRAKWPLLIRYYWKISEQIMVKYADLVICDSINIQRYIHESYDGKGRNNSNPVTTYIAYGAETRNSILSDNDPRVISWYKDKGLRPMEYYLVVGRFVPENNYEVMIREFMKSKTSRKFAIITNVNESFLNGLEDKLHFRADPRIKFVGTVYDQELLLKIRENAYGYLHGHEVGGTNPSLLEALGSTQLNLLLDVGFNNEVATNAALYWSKNEGDLSRLIDYSDSLSQFEISEFNSLAKKRVADAYSWQYIADKYAQVFLHKW